MGCWLVGRGLRAQFFRNVILQGSMHLQLDGHIQLSSHAVCNRLVGACRHGDHLDVHLNHLTGALLQWQVPVGWMCLVAGGAAEL